jgi:hypothetical protein
MDSSMVTAGCFLKLGDAAVAIVDEDVAVVEPGCPPLTGVDASLCNMPYSIDMMFTKLTDLNVLMSCVGSSIFFSEKMSAVFLLLK